MNWLSVVENIGTFGIASGLLVWLVKSLTKQSLARDLEKFKAILRREHAAEIAQLKSDLRAASFEHDIRFARLHEKRAQIVAELYKQLVQTEDAVGALVGDTEPHEPEEQEQLFREANTKTSKQLLYFEERRIYFDERVCTLMDKLMSSYQQVWLYGSPYVELTPEQRAKTQQNLNALIETIPPIRRSIETLMREMLGVGTKSSEHL
jgi:hypothetical protein